MCWRPLVTRLFGSRYLLQKSSQQSLPSEGWGSTKLAGTSMWLKNGISASVKTLGGGGWEGGGGCPFCPFVCKFTTKLLTPLANVNKT